jgi:hypothetical protein
MLYIEGEPVPGLMEDAIHTVYGDGTVQGTANFFFNSDELEKFSPPEGDQILVIGMENIGFTYFAQQVMAAIRPRCVITLGVASDHKLYTNGTHLDVYLREREADGDFLGLAVSKKFRNFDDTTIQRPETGKWIADRVDGRLVEVSYIKPDINIELL